MQRFLKARDAGCPDAASSPDRRHTVGALLRAGDERRAKREETAAHKSAAGQARREHEVAVARAQYLDRLGGQESRWWADIEDLVRTRLPKNYEQVVNRLVDLRDLASPAGDDGNADIQARLDCFRTEHARKPTLLERVVRAGL